MNHAHPTKTRNRGRIHPAEAEPRLKARSSILIPQLPKQYLSFFCLAASQPGKGIQTHRTHWPAAELLDFSRMRSGCVCNPRSISRATPWQAEDARRMRGEYGL